MRDPLNVVLAAAGELAAKLRKLTIIVTRTLTAGWWSALAPGEGDGRGRCTRASRRRRDRCRSGRSLRLLLPATARGAQWGRSGRGRPRPGSGWRLAAPVGC